MDNNKYSDGGWYQQDNENNRDIEDLANMNDALESEYTTEFILQVTRRLMKDNMHINSLKRSVSFLWIAIFFQYAVMILIVIN